MSATAAGRLIVILFLSIFLFGPSARAACTNDCASQAGAENKPINLKKYTKKASRVADRKRHPHRIVSRQKNNSDKARAAANTEVSRIPLKVADARAEMMPMGMAAKDDTGTKADGDKTTGMAPTTESAATGPSEASVEVVNADELNELDRAAAQTRSGSGLPPALANARAEMREDQSSAWGQTSMIGKAFIVMGVLLTFASAARMFMA